VVTAINRQPWRERPWFFGRLAVLSAATAEVAHATAVCTLARDNERSMFLHSAAEFAEICVGLLLEMQDGIGFQNGTRIVAF
jgi:hypothetical protein